MWTTSSCNLCHILNYIASYKATHAFLYNILKIPKNIKNTEHYLQFVLPERTTVLFLKSYLCSFLNHLQRALEVNLSHLIWGVAHSLHAAE